MTTIIGSGTRLSHWGNETNAVRCDICGEHRTHRIADLKKGMPANTPVDVLWECLTLHCPRKGVECGVELVSPDDGVAD